MINFRLRLAFIDEIVTINRLARLNDNFSDRFYSKLLMAGIKLLPGRPASDTVLLMKAFSEKKEHLGQLVSTSVKLKEHIRQEMMRQSIQNICYLIDLYRDDVPFSKYLLTCLLEKMNEGKKLDFETFLIAMVNSLKHKEHTKELVDTLFNFEMFYSAEYSNLMATILEAVMKEGLYDEEQGKRLISAI